MASDEAVWRGPILSGVSLAPRGGESSVDLADLPYLCTTVAVAPVVTTAAPTPLCACRGLWDTGATHSAVSRRLVRVLGLLPYGDLKVTIRSSAQGTIEIRPTYLIRLALPGDIILPIMATEFDVLDGDDFDVLVGMDVIGLGEFSMRAVGGRRYVTFRVTDAAAGAQAARAGLTGCAPMVA